MTAAITAPTHYTDESGTRRKITPDENGILRDQWKRPVVRKTDGTWAGFSRISSIAKELDAGIGLTIWKACMTALGVSIDPDIRRRIEEMAAFSDNPYDEHKRELIRLTDQAQEIAGSAIKRDLGTELHEWAQIYDRTGDLDLLPGGQVTRSITAYRDRLRDHGITVLESEIFVVTDDIEIAGSLDKLVVVEIDGRARIADIKSGQDEPKYPMNVEMQTAGYARGARYNLSTHERSPIHPDLDTDEGILIHLPSNTGTCELYPLNLRRGWQNLMLAKDLKTVRKASGRKLTPIPTPVKAAVA